MAGAFLDDRGKGLWEELYPFFSEGLTDEGESPPLWLQWRWKRQARGHPGAGSSPWGCGCLRLTKGWGAQPRRAAGQRQVCGQPRLQGSTKVRRSSAPQAVSGELSQHPKGRIRPQMGKQA